MTGMPFSSPMILALKNTKPNCWPAEPIDPSKPWKWQTRRLFTKQPDGYFIGMKDTLGYPASAGCAWAGFQYKPDKSAHYYKARYRPGQEYYCKEGLKKGDIYDGVAASELGIFYAADDEYCSSGWCWQRDFLPPIFMPRDLARMAVKVMSARAERLQDISEEDAEAEGIERVGGDASINPWRNYRIGKKGEMKLHCSAPTRSYMTLIDSLHGPGTWEANLWVFRYEIQRTR